MMTFKKVLSNCLATTHPELIKEWHPTKNGNLTPFDVTFGQRIKIWWQCSKVDDHEWVSTINNRTANVRGCPYCSGRKAVLSNSLATTYPEISKNWHPTKNLPLTPYDVTSGSGKKVWWKCDAQEDHEWVAAIHSRVRGNGCGCCSNGRNVVLSNCLATTNPELINQWHPTKNNSLTPFDVTSGSGKKVWWKCDAADDHEWEAPVTSRTRGYGCPCCRGLKIVLSNCFKTTHPKIATQWHTTKNFPLTPSDVVGGTDKIFWWKCPNAKDHEWKSSVNNRTNGGKGCPYCCESIGEKRIKFILDELNIQYEVQKKFDECKYKQKLSFDFYLSKYNALIEYDGMQHFKPIKWFGGIKGFNVIKKRDKIKTEFASKKNIPLFRIPYTKFDIIKKEIEFFISFSEHFTMGSSR